MNENLRTMTIFSDRTPAWQRQAGVIVWAALLLFAAVIALIPVSQLPLLQSVLAPVSDYVSPEKAMYSPLAYMVLFSCVMWFETTKPCRRQAIFSVSFFQDLMWYVIRLTCFVYLLGAYTVFLQDVYAGYFSYLTLDVSAWPAGVRFVAALLLTDFLRWFSHLVRHKVPLFWTFHAVHHSQRELNLFTDARVHPVDIMVSSTIKFIPMFMFQNAVSVILAWAVVETVYPKFYHANVKLNFGPLRYILVTPQSHRLHHSREPEHADRNFGFIFSIWDRIFGTHWLDDEDYAETGIEDPDFPIESGGGVKPLFGSFCRQFVYPFKQAISMGRDLVGGGQR